MLLSDISIFRFTINMGEHRVIVRGIMSLYYDILSFYFTSCYDTITSYDIAVLSYSYFSSFFFRQRHVLSVVMLSLYFTILSLHFDR